MKFAHQSATIRQHGKGMIILETALETAGLTYVFPDGNGIKNIAFQVKRGEIYALYGGHHAGKSVLLQTIIGTLRLQAGTLKLFGNIDYQKERSRIGFVPQKPVTIGSLSPADMLRYFSSVFGTTEIHILDIKDIEIDPQSHMVTRKGRSIDLTPIEFELLYLLASHPGQAYSKERLYELIWKEPYFGNENVLNTHINRLRLKLKNNAEDTTAYIKTLWGIGYKMEDK